MNKTINLNEKRTRAKRAPYLAELDELIQNTEAGGYTAENAPAIELDHGQIQTAKKHVADKGHVLHTMKSGEVEKTGRDGETKMVNTYLVYLEAALSIAEKEAAPEKVPAKSRSRAKAKA